MRRRAVLSASLAALALLAGCGSGDGEQAAPDRQAQATGPSDAPLPGRYRTTVRVTGVAIPGMDAKQAAAMFGPQGHASESCLAADGAANGMRRFAAQAERGQCRYEKFTASAGKVEGVMVCAVAQGVIARSQVSGTYSPSGSLLKITAEAGASGQPDSAMRMDSEIASERIGDC
ncbi:DUF3617 domain-containing protein [Novosphingobium sp.]|uniref:DUF3617 domain-containing protein n=1 Tax=Novosphingobium sp. TaxID=1874826 RepID=UPI001EB1075F|nr:DUF3617 domain-containing protein [Novosphingobium sp.]MBK9011239.1 DUF3617 family protein [Novosphingobium sp.]